jgi:hypothetical protein
MTLPLFHALPVATMNDGDVRDTTSASYGGTSDRSVTLQIVCPTWTSTADHNVTVTAEAQQSFDGGTTWDTFGGCSANPPMVNRAGQIGSATVQCIDDRGDRLVRAQLRVDGGTIAVGLDVQFT